MSNELAIDVIDYEGVRVTCTTERWRYKVEADHPELTNRSSEIAAIIATPDLVLQDRDYGNRLHFMRDIGRGLYTIAVVEYRYQHEAVAGRLVTAFLRGRRRRNDSVLYSRKRREQ